MPRTKLTHPKRSIEDLLQPPPVTAQIEQSVLEAALVSALQPLYSEIADLKQSQATSTKALEALIERVQSQESTLMQLLTRLQKLLSGERSSETEQQLQTLLSQLLQTSNSLNESATSLQSAIGSLTNE